MGAERQKLRKGFAAMSPDYQHGRQGKSSAGRGAPLHPRRSGCGGTQGREQQEQAHARGPGHNRTWQTTEGEVTSSMTVVSCWPGCLSLSPAEDVRPATVILTSPAAPLAPFWASGLAVAVGISRSTEDQPHAHPAALGTVPDEVLAKRIGRKLSAVRVKRGKLAIASARDRRRKAK